MGYISLPSFKVSFLSMYCLHNKTLVTAKEPLNKGHALMYKEVGLIYGSSSCITYIMGL